MVARSTCPIESRVAYRMEEEPQMNEPGTPVDGLQLCLPATVCQDLAVSDRSEEDERAELQGDDALFNALLAGAHVENAAFMAGMSVRTAYRRLADPVFRQSVESAREVLRESILTRLSEAAGDAVSRLWELANEGEPEIQLKAAKALLDGLIKMQNAQPRRTTSVEYSVKQSSEG